MKEINYKGPEVNDLSGDEQHEVPAKVETAVKTVSTKRPSQPSFEGSVDTIGIAKMINVEGDATTDVVKARIGRHIEFLSGKLSYPDEEARNNEQVTFINTIANTFRMEFDQFVIVTDFILSQIRENQQIFVDGTAFRFIRALSATAYPREHLETYKSYMAMLTKIAGNWSRRYELNKLIDPTYAIRDIPPRGKENITQYLNKLMNV